MYQGTKPPPSQRDGLIGEPAPLEDAPFRTGGPVADKLLGPDEGYLTGNEAYERQKAQRLAAEQELGDARAGLEAARQEHDRLVNDAGANAALFKREFRRRAGIAAAEERLKNAEAGLAAANRAPLPTQEDGRDTVERVVKSVGSGVADTIAGARGLVEQMKHPQESPDSALAATMEVLAPP